MILHIKNMVCPRCIMVVEEQLNNLGYNDIHVQLGEVTFSNELTNTEIETITKKLIEFGFELLDNKRYQLVSKTKNILIHLVQDEDAFLKLTLSDYLTEKTQVDYNHLSQLFSQIENTTIEQYYINLKIERVKELLVYDELTIKEIAFKLNYSSVAHLSKQFKKVTGLTPTHFKTLGNQKRKLIDTL